MASRGETPLMYMSAMVRRRLAFVSSESWTTSSAACSSAQRMARGLVRSSEKPSWLTGSLAFSIRRFMSCARIAACTVGSRAARQPATRALNRFQHHTSHCGREAVSNRMFGEVGFRPATDGGHLAHRFRFLDEADHFGKLAGSEVHAVIHRGYAVIQGQMHLKVVRAVSDRQGTHQRIRTMTREPQPG